MRERSRLLLRKRRLKVTLLLKLLILETLTLRKATLRKGMILRKRTTSMKYKKW